MTDAAAQLRLFSACDVADGIAFAGIPDGGAIPLLSQQSGSEATVAGPAYTVEYAPLSDPRPEFDGHYIDNAPQGAVVVLAVSPQYQLTAAPFTLLTNSLYGGLMSTRASYLGCAGTVVCGYIRDLNEHQRLKYPVWAYGTAVCAPNKLAKVVAVNNPLQIGGAIVNPGDTIVADVNGVVSLPVHLEKTVLKYVPQRVEADRLAAEDIAHGVPAAQAQKTRRTKILM